MADDQPELFTTELQKNARKGAWYEASGAGIGAGLGSVVAARGNLNGRNFFFRVVDFALFGWMAGIVARLWSERSDNQNSALKLDSKMIHLEQENKLLKHAVTELGGDLPVYKDDHAEKAAATKDCGCRLRH